jgi:hypothetical protein
MIGRDKKIVNESTANLKRPEKRGPRSEKTVDEIQMSQEILLRGSAQIGRFGCEKPDSRSGISGCSFAEWRERVE